MLRFVFGSVASYAIVPATDLIGLDDRARRNYPGTVGSPNWEWCMADFSQLRRRKAWIRRLLLDTNRI